MAKGSEALDVGYFALTPTAAPAKKPPRAAHYRVVCISLYNEDVVRLDGLVAEMKRRGHTKANKSELIRFALEQVDLDKFNKGQR